MENFFWRATILLFLSHTGFTKEDASTTLPPGSGNEVSTEKPTAPSPLPDEDKSKDDAPASSILHGFAKPGEAPEVLQETYTFPDALVHPPHLISAKNLGARRPSRTASDSKNYGALIDYALTMVADKLGGSKKGFGGSGSPAVDNHNKRESAMDNGNSHRVKLSPQELLDMITHHQPHESRSFIDHKKQVEESKDGAQSDVPIATALEQLQEQGFDVKAPRNETNAVMISPPGAATETPTSTSTVTPTTKRPAVDPPTLAVDPSSPEMLPVSDSSTKEPHCPTLSEFIANSEQVLGEMSKAPGVKEGLGVLINAASTALNSLSQCVNTWVQSLGTLLFSSRGDSDTTSSTSATPVPNIKTSAGRNEQGEERPPPHHSTREADGSGQATVVVIDDGEVSAPEPEGKVKRHGVLNDADSLEDSVDKHVDGMGRKVDFVDPALYQ